MSSAAFSFIAEPPGESMGHPVRGRGSRDSCGALAGLARSLRSLLDLDRGAGLFQLALDRIGLVLGDALLDRLRRRVDEVLRLLEAETGDGADDLDHLDLLATRSGEDDVERRLLLGLCSAAACRRAGSRDCNRSGGGDAPLLFDLVLQLDQLED